MIFLNREDLNSNLECPIHKGETFFLNGCGGKDNWINPLLQRLPSSKLFYGACCAHDILYSLVPVEFVSVYYNGSCFELKSRAHVDEFWLMLMLDIANTRPWYSKWLYKHAARRDYQFVKQFGEEYFKHSHK
tara:strand:- start:923 stop:1318 length:396 start_codon:yes stop_codon:yes gene_type:complete